jgi:hypothetical protein
MNIDYANVLERILKYLIEGIAIALVCYFTTELHTEKIIIISITGACCFALLDIYSPRTGEGFRFGLGLGASSNIIGFKIL